MLIAGLVIFAPTAVLLASAALALLVGKLRRRWRQAVNPRLRGPGVTRTETGVTRTETSRPLTAGPETEGLRVDARPLSSTSAARLHVVELELPVPVTMALYWDWGASGKPIGPRPCHVCADAFASSA